MWHCPVWAGTAGLSTCFVFTVLEERWLASLPDIVPRHCGIHWAIKNPSAAAVESERQRHNRWSLNWSSTAALDCFCQPIQFVTLQNGQCTAIAPLWFAPDNNTSSEATRVTYITVCVVFLTWRLANMEPSGWISRFDVDSAQPSCCSCGAAGVLLLRHSLHLPPELRILDPTAAAGVGSSTPVATTAADTESSTICCPAGPYGSFLVLLLISSKTWTSSMFPFPTPFSLARMNELPPLTWE